MIAPRSGAPLRGQNSAYRPTPTLFHSPSSYWNGEKGRAPAMGAHAGVPTMKWELPEHLGNLIP